MLLASLLLRTRSRCLKFVCRPVRKRGGGKASRLLVVEKGAHDPLVGLSLEYMSAVGTIGEQ